MAQQKKSFEDALEELEKIVAEIEEGNVPLEQSIEKYSRGIKLVQQCRGILDAAEEKIRLLAKGEGGALEEAGELEEPAANDS